MIKEYLSSEQNHVLAHRAWHILTAYVMFKQDFDGKGPGLLTYGTLAEQMGYSRQAARVTIAPLGYIHRFCAGTGVPHLNAVVVRSDSHIAGWDEMFPSEQAHLHEQRRVIDTDWFKYRIPAPGTFRKFPYDPSL